MIRTTSCLAALLLFIGMTPGYPANEHEDSPANIERLLHGEWKGGACQGDFTFAVDGTYELRHYTPGNNTLTGRWKVKWNALPPTLVLTCKTSDEPDRFPLGKEWEVRLIQLDDKTLVYQWPDDKKEFKYVYERVTVTEKE